MRLEALKKLKILFVDDNVSMTKLFSLLGIEYGFVALVANSVKDGVKMAAKELPDVVLTDVRMPDGGGYELIGSLKALPATKNIPVVGCSVTYQEEIRDDWVRFGGAKFYNDKPCTLENLNAILEGVVHKLQDYNQNHPEGD